MRLEAKNINAFYGKSQVLFDTNLCVEQGKVVCLSGANGSGKSTLMSVMAGLSGESSNLTHIGNVSITQEISGQQNSTDIYSLTAKSRATKIAFLTQSETQMWNYSVEDLVLSGRFCHTEHFGFYSAEDKKIAGQIIGQLNIEHLAEKNIFELSGGEFQKVRIARCLAQQPDFVLLDEPVANLDFAYQEELLHLLKKIAAEQNIGILLCIHDLNTASRFADTLALMQKKGPCHAGAVKDILNSKLLEQVYDGVRFEIFEHPSYKCPQVCVKP